MMANDFMTTVRGLLVVGMLFQASAGLFAQDTNQAISSEEARVILAQRGAELSDEDLEKICLATDLMELDLTGCNRITDQGLAHVAQLEQLQVLNLFGLY